MTDVDLLVRKLLATHSSGGRVSGTTFHHERALQTSHLSVACNNRSSLKSILFGSDASQSWARQHECFCDYDSDLGGRFVRCEFDPSCSDGKRCLDHGDFWLFDSRGQLTTAATKFQCLEQCGGYSDHTTYVYFDNNGVRQSNPCSIYNPDTEQYCYNCWFEGNTLKYRCSFLRGSEDQYELFYGEHVHPFLDDVKSEVPANYGVVSSTSGIGAGAIFGIVVFVLVILVAGVFALRHVLKQQQKEERPTDSAEPASEPPPVGHGETQSIGDDDDDDFEGGSSRAFYPRIQVGRIDDPDNVDGQEVDGFVSSGTTFSNDTTAQAPQQDGGQANASHNTGNEDGSDQEAVVGCSCGFIRDKNLEHFILYVAIMIFLSCWFHDMKCVENDVDSFIPFDSGFANWLFEDTEDCSFFFRTLKLVAFMVLALLYYFFLQEYSRSSTRRYLQNINTEESITEYLRRLYQTPPAVTLRIECYHFVYRNGDYWNGHGNLIRTVTVTRARRWRTINIVGWSDDSIPLSPNQLALSPVVKLRLTKVLHGDDNYIRECREFVDEFKNLDRRYNFWVDAVIPGFQHQSVYLVDKNRKPFFLSEKWSLFFHVTFFLSFPYRLWLNLISNNMDVKIRKSIETVESMDSGSGDPVSGGVDQAREWLVRSIRETVLNNSAPNQNNTTESAAARHDWPTRDDRNNGDQGSVGESVDEEITTETLRPKAIDGSLGEVEKVVTVVDRLAEDDKDENNTVEDGIGEDDDDLDSDEEGKDELSC